MKDIIIHARKHFAKHTFSVNDCIRLFIFDRTFHESRLHKAASFVLSNLLFMVSSTFTVQLCVLRMSGTNVSWGRNEDSLFYTV